MRKGKRRYSNGNTSASEGAARMQECKNARMQGCKDRDAYIGLIKIGDGKTTVTRLNLIAHC